MSELSQHIEIELKNIITKKEFNSLIQFFKFNEEDFSNQENHYFDTEDFALKKAGCALRIRSKNNQFELTLKQPHNDGLLETNENIDTGTAEKMFQSGVIMSQSIKNSIKEMNIDPSLMQYFGSLTTRRAETEYKNGLIVLDHSFYLNKEDYEIEYEVSNRDEGVEVFSSLLSQLKIPMRKTENKIMRFYMEKYNRQDQI